ncbi:MAG: lipid-A-disaccharide synthase, partial [Deltaproteobacteria bacterium]|nr:lipid-A-disaccharide synthase [Deltaproteobacteria bacterium]
DLDTKDMIIGLLPGSRNEEVLRLLPVMVEVADIITEQMPGLRFAIPLAPSVDKTTVKSIIGKAKSRFLVLSDRLQDILDRSTLLITASGTVTLEATIAGTPMIIIYKVSGLSYWLGKRLIRVKHIGLPNLVAGKPIVPEFIQHQATAKNIARQALALLKDENSLAGMRLQLNHTAQALGPPGASRRAAKVALAMLQPH